MAEIVDNSVEIVLNEGQSITLTPFEGQVRLLAYDSYDQIVFNLDPSELDELIEVLASMMPQILGAESPNSPRMFGVN